jgi:hypothetical protein
MLEIEKKLIYETMPVIGLKENRRMLGNEAKSQTTFSCHDKDFEISMEKQIWTI